MGDLPRIKKSKLDCWDTREEVSLRKLAQTAFDSVSLDALVDVDIAAPDNNEGLFYNLSLNQWENDSYKTVNGQSIRGTGDITITTSGALSGLSDVTITTPLNNQVLTYNGSLSRWENQAVPAPSVALDDLTDVTIVSPTSNQALAWDAVAMEWINTDGDKIVPAAGGTNQIQYNNGSDQFAANANFTFNPSTQTLTVDNIRSNQYINTSTASTIFGTGNANPVLLTTEFLGTVGVANLSVSASNGSALREFKLQSNWSEPRFFDGSADRNVLHAGNIASNAATSVNTRQGAVVLTDSDVPATVVTEAGTSRAMANSDAGTYIRFTSSSAKTATFGTGINVVGQEFHLRNVGANDLTLTPSSTTLNAPAGGTLVIPPGGTVTVKQVGATEFDVFGTTTAA